jgi:hypothetical protein
MKLSTPDYAMKQLQITLRGRSARSRFARQYGLVVIVVAHPTKDVGRDGKARPVTLYDIEGSAHWFNKCDHGVVITRVPDTQVTEVYVAKVRCQLTVLRRRGSTPISWVGLFQKKTEQNQKRILSLVPRTAH